MGDPSVEQKNDSTCGCGTDDYGEHELTCTRADAFQVPGATKKFIALTPGGYHVSPMPDGSFVLHLGRYHFRFVPAPEDGSHSPVPDVDTLRCMARTILEKTDAARSARLTELREQAEFERLSAKFADSARGALP